MTYEVKLIMNVTYYIKHFEQFVVKKKKLYAKYKIMYTIKINSTQYFIFFFKTLKFKI